MIQKQFFGNPGITKAFAKVEYIKEMGEGWNRIVDIIKGYALKFKRLPEVKGNSRVVVTLFSPELEEEKKIDKDKVDEWLTQVNTRLNIGAYEYIP